jgi:inositol 1,4,5-triphosphate receptor type 3
LTAREEENIHLVLNGFKIDLLEYIREKYELLQSHTATYKVYNVLTYEIIKILEIIMKFGLFWTRIDKPKRLNRPRSETLRRIFERAYMKKVNDFEQQMKESQMEKLINYLTYFLEYDENYFIAINTVNL